MFTDESGLN